MGRELHVLQFERFSNAERKCEDWLYSIIHAYIVQYALYTRCYVQYPNIMVIEMCEVRRLQYRTPTALGPASTFMKGINWIRTNISHKLVAQILTTFDHRMSGFKLPCKVDHMIQENISTYTADRRSNGLLVKINNCPVPQQWALKTERETVGAVWHTLNPWSRWSGQL
jgi:hypothetical protein